MKNLIKFAMVSILFISNIAQKAQDIIYGIEGGLNLSKMVVEDEDGSLSEDIESSTGIHFGFNMELYLNDKLSFVPGIYYSQKGFKMDESYEEDGLILKTKTTVKLNYLDVPLLLKGGFDVADNTKLYGVFGPYLGYGLNGKTESSYKVYSDGELLESDSETYDVDWGSDEDEDMLKRLDYGLTFGAGFQYQSFNFGIKYNLGLANISADQEDGLKIKNRVLQFSLGYRFGN